jgi:hypothetical protein
MPPSFASVGRRGRGSATNGWSFPPTGGANHQPSSVCRLGRRLRSTPLPQMAGRSRRQVAPTTSRVRFAGSAGASGRRLCHKWLVVPADRWRQPPAEFGIGELGSLCDEPDHRRPHGPPPHGSRPPLFATSREIVEVDADGRWPSSAHRPRLLLPVTEPDGRTPRRTSRSLVVLRRPGSAPTLQQLAHALVRAADLGCNGTKRAASAVSAGGPWRPSKPSSVDASATGWLDSPSRCVDPLRPTGGANHQPSSVCRLGRRLRSTPLPQMAGRSRRQVAPTTSRVRFAGSGGAPGRRLCGWSFGGVRQPPALFRLGRPGLSLGG